MLTPHQALAGIWADRMPITSALGIALVEFEDRHLVLAMPLGPNRNHKGTVFAGSLSALATLAGWSAVWLALREAGVEAHVVIQDAQIHYLSPTRSDVTAATALPEPATWQRVMKSLDRRGRARLTVTAELRDVGGAVVARFSGRYVVHRDAVPPETGN